MPELITETLLVTVPFKDRGVDYVVGDRVPVRHRAIRRLAAQHPSWFAMEFAPEDLDLEWLADIEEEAEEKYKVQKRLGEEAKARQKRAIRHELDAQDQPRPGELDLERRFKKQEAEEKKRKEKMREEREREAVESQVTLTGNYLSGFHFDD
jgi:hypothetical protein